LITTEITKKFVLVLWLILGNFHAHLREKSPRWQECKQTNKLFSLFASTCVSQRKSSNKAVSGYVFCSYIVATCKQKLLTNDR